MVSLTSSIRSRRVGRAAVVVACLGSFAAAQFVVFATVTTFPAAAATDPVVMAAAILTMALLGIAASAIPALRALAVDPSKLLREE